MVKRYAKSAHPDSILMMSWQKPKPRRKKWRLIGSEPINCTLEAAKGSAMPLEWLEKLSHVFGKFKPELRERFDQCCCVLAEMSTAPSKPVDLEELDT
ncbi:MAG: hypothetical protein HYT22_04070 [Candidatus Niyogibacteria bacterium]|nr:hypothetical protein [Candidatus Niyogibacteria bacterium]